MSEGDQNNPIFRDFQAEDAAIYVGNIFIEKSKDENYKCSVTVTISLKGYSKFLVYVYFHF